MIRYLGFGERISLICVLTVAFAGCGNEPKKPANPAAQNDKHGDDHATPESFAAGVELLKEQYLEIKTAFEAEKDDDAHEPLHGIGNVLEALPDLAKSAELATDQQQVVQDAIGKMFEAYGQIDSAMHHGKKPDYAAVSESLDTSMAVLETAVLQ